MTDQPKGFWSSIQGILTGIAAVITAVTGLYLAINDDNTISQPDKTGPDVTAPPSAPKSSTVIQPQDKTPFPEIGALVDCTVFPTVNTVNTLMGWSNYYHKQIIAADGINKRAIDPCNQAIDQRGMAHCKQPDNIEVRNALLETLTLCRAAGVEWTNIKHSTIIEQE